VAGLPGVGVPVTKDGNVLIARVVQESPKKGARGG
jgi:hypothetical protein